MKTLPQTVAHQASIDVLMLDQQMADDWNFQMAQQV